MSYRILLVGGGTGGHIYPLVAVAEELKSLSAQNPIELEFMGDTDLLKKAGGELGVPVTAILSPKWRAYFSIQNFLDLIKLPFGIIQSLFYVWKFMPDVIFVKGGYASLLPALVGKLYLIPIVLHESDSVAGRTNLFLGKFAKKIFLNFETAKQYFPQGVAEVSGHPIRKALLQVAEQSQALSQFQLQPNIATVFITGASQGSQIINEVLLLTLPQLLKDFQVIHQCGEANLKEFSVKLDILKKENPEIAKELDARYRMYGTMDATQMGTAYSASDIVVSRAGSMVFEMAARAKPTIVIPLKGSASDHQAMNAQEFAKYGVIIIEQDNLTSHILINQITTAYTNRQQLGPKIQELSKPNAANIIAQALLNN